MQLHQAIVEGEADYQDALDKSLRIPGCKVVPYFGVFLDQLVSVWEEPSPALSMSMLEMEREVRTYQNNSTQFVSHFVHPNYRIMLILKPISLYW